MNAKNILIIPIGGFGNNLFQISYGFFLQNEGYQVSYDFFLTEKNIFTKLLKWKTHDNSYKIPALNKKKTSFFNRFKILIKIGFSKIIKSPIGEAKFVFPNENLGKLNLKKIKYITGYFQETHQISYYREGLNSTIKLLLKERLTLVKKSLAPIDNVIHYRGKDSNYLHENIKALELLDQMKGKWVVISDDKSFFENKLAQIDVEINNSTPIIDFCKLSLAKRKLICSNSTFSWWASHLVSKKTEVIFPKSLYLKSGYWGKGKLKIIEP